MILVRGVIFRDEVGIFYCLADWDGIWVYIYIYIYIYSLRRIKYILVFIYILYNGCLSTTIGFMLSLHGNHEVAQSQMYIKHCPYYTAFGLVSEIATPYSAVIYICIYIYMRVCVCVCVCVCVNLLKKNIQ